MGAVTLRSHCPSATAPRRTRTPLAPPPPRPPASAALPSGGGVRGQCRNLSLFSIPGAGSAPRLLRGVSGRCNPSALSPRPPQALRDGEAGASSWARKTCQGGRWPVPSSRPSQPPCSAQPPPLPDERLRTDPNAATEAANVTFPVKSLCLQAGMVEVAWRRGRVLPARCDSTAVGLPTADPASGDEEPVRIPHARPWAR